MSKPTIIVTGASQGLGAAIAARAADSGARVVLTARSKAGLEAQAEKIRQAGGEALVIPADVSRGEDCEKIIEQSRQAFGQIDALVNNAAIIEPLSPVKDIEPAAWSQLMAVNLLAPLMLCQLAIPHLRRTRGRVINITSQAAEAAIPGASAYSTSKAALNRFSKVLAAEEPDITVILFGPGDVDTAMQEVIRSKGKGKTPEAFYQFLVGLYEKGQLLAPEIPAEAAVRLALQAPQAWSGEIIEWDDERLAGLA